MISPARTSLVPCHNLTARDLAPFRPVILFSEPDRGLGRAARGADCCADRVEGRLRVQRVVFTDLAPERAPVALAVEAQHMHEESVDQGLERAGCRLRRLPRDTAYDYGAERGGREGRTIMVRNGVGVRGVRLRCGTEWGGEAALSPIQIRKRHKCRFPEGGRTHTRLGGCSCVTGCVYVLFVSWRKGSVLVSYAALNTR